MAIPGLVAFAMALVWALVAASAQIRCVDAARAGARAAARSEPRSAAVDAARAAAPEGADVSVGRTGDLWHVRVEAPTPGPRAMALTLTAEAVASAEDVPVQEDAPIEANPPAADAGSPGAEGVPAVGASTAADGGGTRGPVAEPLGPEGSGGP